MRPILSDNCFLCHGPDKSRRKADLRLDVRADAIKAEALVPGKPGESSLVDTDPERRRRGAMPPPKSNKKLTSRQKEILKRWIEQGAEYQQHWSYEQPVKAEIPAGQNAVDVLVRRRLAEVGLKPSPEADRRTLIRRLSSDLVGLPPSPEEVRAFVERSSRPRPTSGWSSACWQAPITANAWRSAGSTSCGSPTRSAITATTRATSGRTATGSSRASTTTSPSTASPWSRSPATCCPTRTSRRSVGSAFNRLLLSTEEGGAQPKDYEARMLTDRVRAIGAVWLGQTTGCGQCHDHKFDPFTMRDFYSLGAFFADIEEPIIGHREEGMAVTTPDDAEDPGRTRRGAGGGQERGSTPSTPQLDAAEDQWAADVVRYGDHAARAGGQVPGHPTPRRRPPAP